MKATSTTPKKKATRTYGGNMKPAEIKPLIMAARAAYDRQSELGLVDADFNTWRHEQVQAAVGQPGLTACNHSEYRPLMAHFKILSGDDSGALKDMLHTGPARDHSGPGDTHEERRVLAHHIAQAIREHENAGGTIGVGYVVTIARHKTRRPNLTLNGDFQAALADRCTVSQLTQIRATVINRIAAAEGRGEAKTRNRSQSTKKAKESRSTGTLAPRFTLP